MVKFDNPKVDVGSPVFNYSIAYDTKNAKPLFYEIYLGQQKQVYHSTSTCWARQKDSKVQ